MRATMNGCEIVCPLGRGIGWSRYACCFEIEGTNSLRGTRAIAERTRSFRTPRDRICSSTIRVRCARKESDSTTKFIKDQQPVKKAKLLFPTCDADESEHRS